MTFWVSQVRIFNIREHDVLESIFTRGPRVVAGNPSTIMSQTANTQLLSITHTQLHYKNTQIQYHTFRTTYRTRPNNVSARKCDLVYYVQNPHYPQYPLVA